jgi:hypothetical protein
MFLKRVYGTLSTIPDISQPGGTRQVWFPDTRNIGELWAEARTIYTNAATTTAPRFDNPAISDELLT